MRSTQGVEGLFLAVHIGGRRFALPAPTVERILPMASLIPLPGEDDRVVGLLNVHGSVLPVVDPRSILGVRSVAPHRDHRLVLIASENRYLLWVDAADELVRALATEYDAPVSDVQGRPMLGIAQRAEETIPILAVDALCSRTHNLQRGLVPR